MTNWSVKCKKCNGRGVVGCGSCHGTGTLPSGDVCRRCDGGLLQCPVCEGHATVPFDGTCFDCGQVIDVAYLKANPYTAICQSCQSKREQLPVWDIRHERPRS
jgi:hypothetical protein